MRSPVCSSPPRPAAFPALPLQPGSGSTLGSEKGTEGPGKRAAKLDRAPSSSTEPGGTRAASAVLVNPRHHFFPV